MLIWLIKDGELLPIDDVSRPMRAGMLANALLARGHTVIWWASTFSHQYHRLRYPADRSIAVGPSLTLRFLHAGGYCRNVSWQRYRHDEIFARRFMEEAGRVSPPDVVVCALPINAVAKRAVDYASSRGVPSVIDVRDLWPDLWVERTPRLARPMMKVLLRGHYRRTRDLLHRATSVVAVSDHYLRWATACGHRRDSALDAVFYIGHPGPTARRTMPSPHVKALASRLQGRHVAVFVGSFSDSFNLELIMRAARWLHDAGDSSVHFVLAGDGGQFERLTRLARPLPNITLTGWLRGEDVSVLLAMSHVALAPYRLVHAVPNKLFEYMAAGLPIVSSLTGEAAVLIENAGIGSTYDVDDLKGLVDDLWQLMSNPDLRRVQGARARQLYEERFRAECIYESFAAHIEGIAETRRLPTVDVHPRTPLAAAAP